MTMIAIISCLYYSLIHKIITLVCNMTLAGLEHCSNRAFPDARCYVRSSIIIIINHAAFTP